MPDPVYDYCPIHGQRDPDTRFYSGGIAYCAVPDETEALCAQMLTESPEVLAARAAEEAAAKGNPPAEES